MLPGAKSAQDHKEHAKNPTLFHNSKLALFLLPPLLGRSCQSCLWNISPHPTHTSKNIHTRTHTDPSVQLPAALQHHSVSRYPPSKATTITWSTRSRWHTGLLRARQSWDLLSSSCAAYLTSWNLCILICKKMIITDPASQGQWKEMKQVKLARTGSLRRHTHRPPHSPPCSKASNTTPQPRILPCWKSSHAKNLYTNVHRSIMLKSQKME